MLAALIAGGILTLLLGLTAVTVLPTIIQDAITTHAPDTALAALLEGDNMHKLLTVALLAYIGGLVLHMYSYIKGQ